MTRPDTRHPAPGTGPKGQILVIAVLILCVLAIIVPVLVMYSQRESKWSVAQSRSNTAFHLAEAATERGYLIVAQSTTTYQSIQNGAVLTGYNYDTAYTDVPGGRYAIRITSGTNPGEVVITGVGKDSSGSSVRTLEIIWANSPFGNVALWANGGVTVTGNNFTVEWGAIMTPKTITVNGRKSPQLWSAGSIDLDTNAASPPNCDSPDCCFWHSYNSSIPPTPTIDFSYYKSSAVASGTYYSGNQSWTSKTDTTGKVWYIDGNLSMATNNYIKGDLIVIGDLNPSGGNWGNGGVTATMGTKAWKQYCNNWTYYKTKTGASGNGYWADTGAAASFPGLTSNYTAGTITASLPKVVVYGFMYVGGNLNWAGGGGNADFLGVAYINGNATLDATSHATIWYNGDVAANIKTSNVVLSRISWKEYRSAWPTGL